MDNSLKTFQEISVCFLLPKAFLAMCTFHEVYGRQTPAGLESLELRGKFTLRVSGIVSGRRDAISRDSQETLRLTWQSGRTPVSGNRISHSQWQEPWILAVVARNFRGLVCCPAIRLFASRRPLTCFASEIPTGWTSSDCVSELQSVEHLLVRFKCHSAVNKKTLAY